MLWCEIEDLPAQLAGFDCEASEGYRQLETPGAGASRIEIEHTVANLLLRDVAVTRDDSGETGKLRLEVELLQNMQNIYREPADLDNVGLRDFVDPIAVVGVAVDGGDRSDFRKLYKDRGISDVARMNDMVGTSQRGDGLGPEQAVSIRDDPDEHCQTIVV
jgi:hypothetical protein